MTTRAYVLIEATIGKGREVAAALKNVKPVTDSYLITGPYDVIAVVQGESADDINTIVTNQVHTIAGIARTVTCLTIPVPRAAG
jgi:DNA-binding Lrp family transcriptional regulator